MTIVFQYGSNTDSKHLNAEDRLNGDARSIGIAYTENKFELDFTVWSKRNRCAAADIVPGSGISIWGVLYEVPDYLIKRESSGRRTSLDAIEGEGRNYKRVPIRLKRPDGSFVEAVTYVVIKKETGLKTSLEYVRHIIIGLRGHETPEEYINYVKGRVVANNQALKDQVEML